LLPATVLNTIVAESIDEWTDVLEPIVGAGTSIEDALWTLLSNEIPSFRRIVCNGDNYSDEWVEEAAHRGLLLERYGPAAVARLCAGGLLPPDSPCITGGAYPGEWCTEPRPVLQHRR